jgi:prepilin-type N-terminal cleavage/methylation domain-containing protein
MATEPRRDGRAGFTLIEVLVAMVILAIGVLGLQMLTITAAQATAQAERNSVAAAIAAEHLELAARTLRQGELPEQYCRTTDDAAYRVSRRVVPPAPPASSAYQVIVDVTPLRGNSRTFTVDSHVFIPNLVGAPAGSPCAN